MRFVKTVFCNNNFRSYEQEPNWHDQISYPFCMFTVTQAVGNLRVFEGPDLNEYGYFFVRVFWAGFGLPADIMEEYSWLGISGEFNEAVTGIVLLALMEVRLLQFRSADFLRDHHS